jgi:MoaA/NifB/PqqE/SkfB family radical SAM enzyme
MPVAENRIRLKDAVPLDKPYSVYIQPCNVCNFKCQFCTYPINSAQPGWKPEIMPLSTCGQIVENIGRSFGAVKKITLTSAETLLNPEIAEIVKLCKTVANCVSIITNGSKLTNSMSDKLLEAGLDELKISLNGLSDADFRKYVHANVDFNEYVSNITYYSAHNKNTTVGGGGGMLIIKVMDYMLDTPEKHRKFAETFGGLGELRVEHVIQFDKRIDFGGFLPAGYRSGDISFSGVERDFRKAITCSLCFYQLRICENGDVRPCCAPFAPAPTIGNALIEDLGQVWQKQLKLQRQMLNGYWTVDGCKACLSPTMSGVFSETDYLDDDLGNIVKRYEM